MERMPGARRGPKGRTPLVYVVEDDAPLAALMRDVLEAEGYVVAHAATGAAGRALLDEARPDLVVLDLRLPDEDGLCLCADLSGEGRFPVLVCSGVSEPSYRLLARRLGAVDFIPKPFHVGELLHCVAAAVERRPGGPPPAPAPPAPVPPASGALTLCVARRRLEWGGVSAALSPAEFRLLAILLEPPDTVRDTAELAWSLLGADDPPARHAVETTVRKLRGRLRAAGFPDGLLPNAYGHGYMARSRAPDPGL